MMAGDEGPRLRAVAARSISLSRVERPLRALAERIFGGCVLAFHDLPAARFRELVDALAPSTVVALEELVARLRAGRSTAGVFAITVDDGVGETVRALSAVALERHWPITFFLPTRYLDTGEPMPFQWLNAVMAAAPHTTVRLGGSRFDLASREERARFERNVRLLAYTRPAHEYAPVLRELAERGIAQGWFAADTCAPPPPISWEEVAGLAVHPEIRFESHGATHTAVSALSPTDLDRELRESRDRIGACAGRPARHFCYPYGGPESIGRGAPRLVANYYESAVTMSRGRLRGRDRWLLPRIPLYPRDTAEVARLKMLTR